MVCYCLFIISTSQPPNIRHDICQHHTDRQGCDSLVSRDCSAVLCYITAHDQHGELRSVDKVTSTRQWRYCSSFFISEWEWQCSLLWRLRSPTQPERGQVRDMWGPLERLAKVRGTEIVIIKDQLIVITGSGRMKLHMVFMLQALLVKLTGRWAGQL